MYDRINDLWDVIEDDEFPIKDEDDIPSSGWREVYHYLGVDPDSLIEEDPYQTISEEQDYLTNAKAKRLITLDDYIN